MHRIQFCRHTYWAIKSATPRLARQTAMCTQYLLRAFLCSELGRAALNIYVKYAVTLAADAAAAAASAYIVATSADAAVRAATDACKAAVLEVSEHFDADSAPGIATGADSFAAAATARVLAVKVTAAVDGAITARNRVVETAVAATRLQKEADFAAAALTGTRALHARSCAYASLLGTESCSTGD
jgi:hypothetical protein